MYSGLVPNFKKVPNFLNFSVVIFKQKEIKEEKNAEFFKILEFFYYF